MLSAVGVFELDLNDGFRNASAAALSVCRIAAVEIDSSVVSGVREFKYLVQLAAAYTSCSSTRNVWSEFL
jgi:hypothetical protein